MVTVAKNAVLLLNDLLLVSVFLRTCFLIDGFVLRGRRAHGARVLAEQSPGGATVDGGTTSTLSLTVRTTLGQLIGGQLAVRYHPPRSEITHPNDRVVTLRHT